MYLRARMIAKVSQGETETKTTRIFKAALELLWKSWPKQKQKPMSKQTPKHPP